MKTHPRSLVLLVSILAASALAGCEGNAPTSAPKSAAASASSNTPPPANPRGAPSLDAKVVPPASSACNTFGASKSRCFTNVSDACEDIGCPKEHCVSTASLPGLAVCRPK